MTTSPAYLLRIDSPIGRIELTSEDGERLASLSIERDGALPHDECPENAAPVLLSAAGQLTEYFAGERTAFDVPVDLAGTAFQKAVWSELQALGWGQYASYGELGLAIGKPHSGRAIGQAVGANPVPIIVGCHRVLAGDGRITGYSGGQGVPTKVWLLDHEGIRHRGAAPALFELAPAAS